MLKDINVEALLTMKEDDIREILVDKKLNKQELRELIYRILRTSREYKSALNYEREQNAALTEKINDVFEQFSDIL